MLVIVSYFDIFISLFTKNNYTMPPIWVKLNKQGKTATGRELQGFPKFWNNIYYKKTTIDPPGVFSIVSHFPITVFIGIEPGRAWLVDTAVCFQINEILLFIGNVFDRLFGYWQLKKWRVQCIYDTTAKKLPLRVLKS